MQFPSVRSLVEQAVFAGADIQGGFQGRGAGAQDYITIMDAGELYGTVPGIVTRGRVALFIEGGFFIIDDYQAEFAMRQENSRTCAYKHVGPS